jgi:hypothetical protein
MGSSCSSSRRRQQDLHTPSKAGMHQGVVQALQQLRQQKEEVEGEEVLV